jgi:hypothetical protein
MYHRIHYCRWRWAFHLCLLRWHWPAERRRPWVGQTFAGCAPAGRLWYLWYPMLRTRSGVSVAGTYPSSVTCTAVAVVGGVLPPRRLRVGPEAMIHERLEAVEMCATSEWLPRGLTLRRKYTAIQEWELHRSREICSLERDQHCIFGATQRPPV